MDDFSDFRVALNGMLTARFEWYRTRLTEPERAELLEAVTAQCFATRSTIREQAARVAREAEDRKRMEPIELPCFACGQTARRVDGQWFDDEAVYAAWAKHHRIVDDDDEDLAEARASLGDHAAGDEGAHAMCSLILAVRRCVTDGKDYPAHVVTLP